MTSSALFLSLAVVSCLMGVEAFKPVTFAVMGDWGWGKDGDYTFIDGSQYLELSRGQKAVAAGMNAMCKAYKCDFVINTGDNFYDLGISSNLGVYDPQWTTSFEDVYSGPYLQNIKFYGVLGNHDYGKASPVNATVPSTGSHSIQPQLEYTSYDPKGRWYIPTRYYTARPHNGFGNKKLDLKVQITALDSSPFISKYCTKPTAKYYTPELLYGCQPNVRQGMQDFLNRTLNEAKATSDWSIVVCHHPIVGTTGPNEPLNSIIAPILAEAGNTPQLWFNGHDHVTGATKNSAAPKTNFFTIGASGIADPTDLPPSPVDPAVHPYTSGNNGFAIVRLYKSAGEIFFYGINMSDPVAAANPTMPTLQHYQKFFRSKA